MWILEFDLVNGFDTKVQVYRFVAQDVLKLLGNPHHFVAASER